MSSRVSPTIAQDKRAPHEDQLSQMHDALYQLGDQARPALSGNGADLLPPDVAPPTNPAATAAKKHISRLHKAFKSLKKGKG